jgi:hypothetical protein
MDRQNLDFDVTITGFSMPEIDVLIGGLDAPAQRPDPADAVPEIAGPAVTRLGDIWQNRSASLDLRRRYRARDLRAAA